MRTIRTKEEQLRFAIQVHKRLLDTRCLSRNKHIDNRLVVRLVKNGVWMQTSRTYVNIFLKTLTGSSSK